MFRKTVTLKADRVQTDKTEAVETRRLIEGILENDSRIIGTVYDLYFTKIRSMVHNFQNLNLDAEDVFQDGLTRADINIRKGSFRGESSFSTYLYGICRNICLKTYNKHKGAWMTELGETTEELPEDNFDMLLVISAEKDKLDDDCKRIIDMRFGIDQPVDSTRFEKIAAALNIKTDNARQRFGRCFAKLLKLLRQNKEFNLLKS